MMTGTQIIRFYCQNWYIRPTVCVIGPQKPKIVLAWGTFCKFCAHMILRSKELCFQENYSQIVNFWDRTFLSLLFLCSQMYS